MLDALDTTALLLAQQAAEKWRNFLSFCCVCDFKRACTAVFYLTRFAASACGLFAGIADLAYRPFAISGTNFAMRTKL